jgi:hypothetical protein
MRARHATPQAEINLEEVGDYIVLEYGKKVHTGLLLHTGNTREWLAPDVLATPWWRIL